MYVPWHFSADIISLTYATGCIGMRCGFGFTVGIFSANYQVTTTSNYFYEIGVVVLSLLSFINYLLDRYCKILCVFATYDTSISSFIWTILFFFFFSFFFGMGVGVYKWSSNFFLDTDKISLFIGGRVVRTYILWIERNNLLCCPWSPCNPFSKNAFQGTSGLRECLGWNSKCREWRLCWNCWKYFASISAPYFIDPGLSGATPLLVRPAPFSVFPFSQ